MGSLLFRARRALAAVSAIGVAAVCVPGAAQAAVAPYREAVLATNPVAYWGLGETSGPAVDQVAGKNGVYVPGSVGILERGARGARISGKWDEAVRIRDESNLDGGGGAGGYVSTPLEPGGIWEGRHAFSVNLWLRWDGPRFWRGSPAIEGILGNRTGAPFFVGWSLYLPGGVGNGRLNVFRDASQPGVASPESLQEGRWTMVTITYDGSVLRLYQDGEEVASRLDASHIGGRAPLSIGRQDFNNFLSGYHAYFNGAIDEVSVWSRGLGPAEIASFYRKPLEAEPAILVFVPGIAGSELELERNNQPNLDLWPDILLRFWLRDELEVAPDGTTSRESVKASRILDSVYTQPAYRDALRTFEDWEASGTLSDFLPFPYDWRLGVRFAADRLADEISERCGRAPIWLAGHSTGGLVVKRALRLLRERGVDPEDCLGAGGVFFLGTPHAGAPKAIGAVINPDLFFTGGILRRAVPQKDLARLLNNWLTAWQLMPRRGGAGVPAIARETWFDNPNDGLGDRNIAGQLLNWTLDDKADDAHPYHQSLELSTGALPVYNVFGYSGMTDGSFAPGRCELSKTGAWIYREVDRNTSLDRVVRGDGTVPGWSSVWPASGLPNQSQYGLANAEHKLIAGDPRVTALMLRAITDVDPALYPPWPVTAGGALRGGDAVSAALAGPKRTWVASICSPALLLATFGGHQVGNTDLETVVNDVPDALVSVGMEESELMHQTLVIPESETGAQPTYRVTAIADGPVSLRLTEPDGSTHDFRLDVATGDVADLVAAGAAWTLRVDRGGDGSIDAVIPANAPQVEITEPPAALEGDTLALSVIAGSPSGDALTFAWEVLEGNAVIAGSGDTAALTVEDGPQTVRLRVRATDEHGRTVVDEADVLVSNAPPTAAAGQPVATRWGIAALFTGTGSDPGAIDNAALSYEWDFGNGSGTGSVVEHEWGEPGAYEARLTVRDKDGASATDAVAVLVARRTAEVVRLWPDDATYGLRSLAASIGGTSQDASARLTGRQLAFSIGALSATGIVDADGRAEVSLPLPPAPGSHAVEAALRGDPLYDDASASGALRIVNSLGKANGSAHGPTAKVTISVHSDTDGLRGNAQLTLSSESLHVPSVTAFGADDETIWLGGVAPDGREVVIRIAHSEREPTHLSIWIERSLVVDEPVARGSVKIADA